MIKHEKDTLKANIILVNNLGDKLLVGGLTAKKPKNINLITDNYPELFQKELEAQSLYTRKASEGEDMINLMKALSQEIKNNKK